MKGGEKDEPAHEAKFVRWARFHRQSAARRRRPVSASRHHAEDPAAGAGRKDQNHDAGNPQQAAVPALRQETFRTANNGRQEELIAEIITLLMAHSAWALPLPRHGCRSSAGRRCGSAPSAVQPARLGAKNTGVVDVLFTSFIIQ